MQKKKLPPVVIHDGATLLFYSPIDARHKHTGKACHWVNGRLLGSASCLIIYRCGEEPETSYYLLGYNRQWLEDQCTLTRHVTLEQAQSQAEFEYAGVSRTWEPVT